MRVKQTACSIAAAAMVLAAGHGASAQIVTVPEGLEVGDSYRLIFVTSTKTSATDTTAAYYNQFVNDLAQSVPELAELGVTWTVAGNVNGATPPNNTGTTGDDAIPTYRLDGVLFAESYTALWGAPSVPVLISEQGEAVTGGRVWTGMGEAMSAPTWNAGGYIGNGGAGGSTGSGNTNYTWYTWGWHGQANTTENHLYAISDVITIAPEPETGVIIQISKLNREPAMLESARQLRR